jgi:hypothetical protein
MQRLLAVLDDCTEAAINSEAVLSDSTCAADQHEGCSKMIALKQAFLKAAEADNRVKQSLHDFEMHAPLHVWHKGDKPLSRELFDPNNHVQCGDYVLIHTSCDNNTDRCWDIARVMQKMERLGNSFLRVNYLLPKGVGVNAAGVSEAWPENWVDYPLVWWPLPGRKIWSNPAVPIDSIWWACTPIKSGQIPAGKQRKIMMAQVQRLKEHIAKETGVYRPLAHDLNGTLEDDTEASDEEPVEVGSRQRSTGVRIRRK